MTLPILLHQVESGAISATEAERLIRAEIDRIYHSAPYGDRDFEINAKLGWVGGLSVLKACLGLIGGGEKV